MRPSPNGRPAPLVGLPASLVGRCTLRPSIRSSPNGLCLRLREMCPRLRGMCTRRCAMCLRLRRVCLSPSGLLAPPVERCTLCPSIPSSPNGLCLRLPEMCTRRCAMCLRLRRICLSPSGLLAPHVGRCTLHPSIPSFPSGLCLRLREKCTRRCAIGGTRARPAMPPWRSAVRRRPTDC